MPTKQRVLIEGVRMIKKHLRKSQDNPQGTIAEREGPIHISNVKVVERDEAHGKGKGQDESDEEKKAKKKESAGSRPRMKRRKHEKRILPATTKSA